MPLDKAKSLKAPGEGANCDWVRISFHGLKKPGIGQIIRGYRKWWVLQQQEQKQ